MPQHSPAVPDLARECYLHHRWEQLLGPPLWVVVAALLLTTGKASTSTRESLRKSRIHKPPQACFSLLPSSRVSSFCCVFSLVSGVR